MTEQEKQSAYQLQRVDCNCNNCGFMKRDIDKYKIWYDWHRERELEEFEGAKAKAIAEAEAIEDESNRRGMLYKANKMRFFFQKDKLINYGFCVKFKKAVSFLPDTCRIETQHCFVHRKDYADPTAK
jgi:hypothetical protein